MSAVSLSNSYVKWAYEVGKRQLSENRRVALVTLVVSAALAAIAVIYRAVYQSSNLPFRRWAVSLTPEEAQDLKASSAKYPPTEIASRLFTYIHQHQLNTPDSKTPQNPQEWLEWLRSNPPTMTHPILPSYQESTPLSLEDEKAVAIQSWAMRLQPLFALFKDPISWKGLLQPIQSSPRLAYTILFNCVAPFAAQALWKEVQNSLPASLQEMGNVYLAHKGKIALASLGLIAWLYYRMTQEKGIITNLTQNFAFCRQAHQGLDLIPGYCQVLEQLLRTVSDRNILWFYPKNTHSTFVGEIGAILGEMTATGRISRDLQTEFPHIKNLQIIEFNLKLFLTEYRDKEEVYRGWQETLKHMTKNSLVVFTDIDAIKPYLFQCPRTLNSDERSLNVADTSSAKILSDLITLSLKQQTIRCLFELDEDDKMSMEQIPELFRLFSPIRAPDITSQELELLCKRLYTAPDVSCPFAPEDIQNLFKHMDPVLDKSPFPPRDIMESIQKALRKRARSWSLNETCNRGQIQKAEQQLYEAQQLKKQLLQKLWQVHQPEPPLLQALLLLEHVVLPLYGKAESDSKKNLLTPSNLVIEMQKQFNRLFGPCTKEERSRIRTLPERLNKVIKGQDAALEAICKAIEGWRTVPPLDGKPLVLFFSGPPGVGKSETATQLAYELNSTYGITETAIKTHEANVRRINLNRNEPGGILGWDKIKSEILLHLLHAPTSVIILEEWDKMRAEDKSSLFELLDGIQNHVQFPFYLSSTNGPFVDKSNAIFVLTSNIEINPKNSFQENVANVEKGILSSFAQERDGRAFISRIDAVIPFQEIADKSSEELIKEFLDAYQKQDILPSSQREAVEKRLRNMNKPTDARELQRVVQKAICEELKGGD